MAYQPGDSFDVFCPNRPSEVEDLLHRLGLQDQKHHHVHISLKKDTKKKGEVHLCDDGILHINYSVSLKVFMDLI